jgi:hypothetical protein
MNNYSLIGLLLFTFYFPFGCTFLSKFPVWLSSLSLWICRFFLEMFSRMGFFFFHAVVVLFIWLIGWEIKRGLAGG